MVTPRKAGRDALRAKTAVGIVAVTLSALAAPAAADDARQLAEQIRQATGVRGGLVVHLGCGDGRLTAALGADPRLLVHGLATERQAVERARQYLQAQGLYGQVSVDQFDGRHLPYVDNLATLIVAADLGDVPRQEAMRVLAPGGTLCLGGGGQWTTSVKPVPADTDEWTHYLHDSSGNAVAHDTVVGPPRHVQWMVGPRHARSHEHTPTINAVVSAGGKIFYVVDQAPAASILRSPTWHVVARDAFNGMLLWKRPLSSWFPHIVDWGQTPPQLQRRLVAADGRVYVTLGYHEPVSALDAETGLTVRVYEGTEGADEIICHRGVLLVVIRKVTEQRRAQLARFARLSHQKESSLYARETAEPLVKQFRSAENNAQKALRAIEADTGRLLWEKSGSLADRLRPLSLCAWDDRIFYQKGREILCFDLKTGQKRWGVSAPATLRLAYEGNLVCANGRTVSLLDARTGQARWSQPASLVSIRDVFVVGGSLWLGGFKPFRAKRGPSWGPYFATQRDLATGKILKQIEPENPSHHHRCYLNKATDRYILAGRRGVEFIDLDSGEVLWHSWVRGVCRYGVMPANGLLYAPPHACGCYITAKLTGFYALAAQRVGALGTAVPVERPQHGPAFGKPQSPTIGPEPDADWPTYRHDASRSGATGQAVGLPLRRRWQTEVRGRLTSPTVAAGRVLVASVDQHRVVALDADTGQTVWQLTTGGRVDSPPTLVGPWAVFGSRDGSVYCVRSADGALAWRVRLARGPERIVVDGQLESVWPVFGSVLVRDGVVWATAGRSSYLDGGIELCRLDLETGKILGRTPIYSPDPETGRQPPQYGPAAMPGALADILSADEKFVYLRDSVFTGQGQPTEETQPHLFTLTGFLDDSWAHRSYWIFGTRCSLSTGCSGRDRKLVYGRLLVTDGSTIYGYGRSNVHWSNQLEDGAYRVFAGVLGERTAKWVRPVGCEARAMVLADEKLLAAGPPPGWRHSFAVGPQRDRAVLVVLSAADGRQLAEYTLDSRPVFDGMAVARGRVYVALEDGQLVCLQSEGKP